MYVMETYLDDDRLPVIEKTKICEEKVTLNSPELIFNFLNKLLILSNLASSVNWYNSTFSLPCFIYLPL